MEMFKATIIFDILRYSLVCGLTIVIERHYLTCSRNG